MNDIKKGDTVEGSMNGEDWYKGIYIKESEICVPHGIFTEAHNEIRYFTSMRAYSKHPSEFTQTAMRS